MKWRTVVAEGYWSLAANLAQTVAASLTVLIGMLLLGLFIGLGSWTLNWSNHVKSELRVQVYFDQTATRAQETAFAARLQTNPYVRPGGMKFVSKTEGYAKMRKEAPGLVDALPFNPLGDAISLTPRTPESTKALYSSIIKPGLPRYVHQVTDGRQISNRVLQVAHIIEGIFFSAALVLVLAAVMLIANTIRLSIFSRRREIEVMKLVGATNWFVRGPFMVEGVLCGLLGSVTAVIVLLFGRTFLMPKLLPNLGGDTNVHAFSFALVSVFLIGSGIAVGLIGTGVTLRRHLRT